MAPSNMRAVDIKGGTGPASALFINDATPVPAPKEGDALVKIKAFGLNRMDLLQREGKYPLPPQASLTLGVEFSGTVESLGAGDHGDFKVGDAVFGLAYGGAYAEYIAVSSKMLLHKQDHLSWEQAAAIPETWITATQALHLVGDRDVGAASVFATAGTDEKCRFVERELGATAAYNYKTTEDWDKRILEATGGKGVDLIVDFIGAPYFQRNLNVAGRDCRWVSLGQMGGSVLPADVNIGALLFKRVRIEGSTLRSREPDYQARLRDKLAEYIPHFKEGGALKVLIDTVLPWEEIVKAHELMESNSSTGKIICTIS
ncbi:zinc-binding dehydrogenase [Apiospora hydei]|uniref:Zinc-binding dehydrogenase n=1 Tax=Apiospora hydei TaxID=1337664 RepID=A0ABR1X386_9PEZI